MPTRRARRNIYTLITLVSAVIWSPIMLMGMIVGVGALGVLCILSLLRCIWVMPVEHKGVRNFYAAMISLGIILLIPCMVVVAIGTGPLTLGPWLLLISGTLLILLSIIVLIELYGAIAERGLQ